MPKSSPRQLAYMRWRNMINRCTKSSDPGFKNYGGRGISVCPEWLASFDAYYAATGDCPGPGLTVDRINNDGNYEPGNVRWATRKVQRANQRYDPMLIKTHCPHGHPYDDENTYMPPQRRARHCRACLAASTARILARKKAERAARGRKLRERNQRPTCPAGHPFDEANTYLDSRGYQHCRTCRAESNARYDVKRKVARAMRAAA